MWEYPICGCMVYDLPSQIPLEYAAVLAVMVGVLIRFYFGQTLFHPRYVKVWNGIRRFGVPILNRMAKRFIGVDKLENYSSSRQYVTTVDGDVSVKELSKKFNQVRNFEVPLLAGFKTNWDGHPEIGTLVAYHGDKAYPGAPNWLRDRQLHVTFFRDDAGDIVVTAHEEANSYRPDLWKDHLFEGSFNIEKGVEMTKHVLDEIEF